MPKKKILIVDDEKDILTTMESILEPEGYEITTEQDGKKSVELTEQKKYDLILLDVRMPFSGEEVLKLMREHALGNPKIVFCTVVARPDVDISNANGYIQKPIDPKRFLEEVKEYL